MNKIKKLTLATLAAFSFATAPMHAWSFGSFFRNIATAALACVKNVTPRTWYAAAGAASLALGCYACYKVLAIRKKLDLKLPPESVSVQTPYADAIEELEKARFPLDGHSVDWETIQRIVSKYRSFANHKDEFERTLLMQAANDGNISMVEWLLDNGADIFARDKEQQTALSFACNKRNENIIQLLVRRGGNRTIDRLQEAIAMNNDSALQTILFEPHQTGHDSTRALLHWRDDNNNTALMLAGRYQSRNTMRFILNVTCEIEQEERTNYLNATNNLGQNVFQLAKNKEDTYAIQQFSRLENPTIANINELMPS